MAEVCASYHAVLKDTLIHQLAQPCWRDKVLIKSASLRISGHRLCALTITHIADVFLPHDLFFTPLRWTPWSCVAHAAGITITSSPCTWS